MNNPIFLELGYFCNSLSTINVETEFRFVDFDYDLINICYIVSISKLITIKTSKGKGTGQYAIVKMANADIYYITEEMHRRVKQHLRNYILTN